MKRCANIRGQCAVAFLLTLILHAADTAPPSGCDKHLYLSPDRRLRPRVVGLLPRHKQPVVGFEVVEQRPLVAFPHSLVEFDTERVSELLVTHTIRGISLHGDKQVIVQSDGGFLQLGNRGLEPDDRLNLAVKGRLYGSGTPVLMEVRARQDVLQFVARRNDERAFPVAAIRGPLRAASWNPLGLAAVVGDSVYYWPPGGKNVVRLLTDRGLNTARDAVVVGDNRIVVALRSLVVLVSPQGTTVVGALPLARCRFSHGTLYVLEESTGMIWSFRGLEQLGTRDADKAFADDLLKRTTNSVGGNDPADFQEAARILGCKEAGQTASEPRSDQRTNPK